jgi:vacuolar-type H+-ATPase subunit I/STV1
VSKPWIVQSQIASGEWVQVRTSTRMDRERFLTSGEARAAMNNYAYQSALDGRRPALRVFDSSAKEGRAMNQEPELHEDSVEELHAMRAKLKRLEAQVTEALNQRDKAFAQAAVCINAFKGLESVVEGKISEETFASILKSAEKDMMDAAAWLNSYVGALTKELAEARNREMMEKRRRNPHAN